MYKNRLRVPVLVTSGPSTSSYSMTVLITKKVTGLTLHEGDSSNKTGLGLRCPQAASTHLWTQLHILVKRLTSQTLIKHNKLLYEILRKFVQSNCVVIQCKHTFKPLFLLTHTGYESNIIARVYSPENIPQIVQYLTIIEGRSAPLYNL